MGVVWAVCIYYTGNGFIHLSIVLKCVKCLNNVSIIFVEKCGVGLTLYNYVKVKVLLT